MESFTFYWINLDRSLARRARMEQQFAERNIKNARISGIDGIKEQLYESGKAIVKKDVTKSIRELNAELGCTLSHLKAIKSFLESNENCAIICEDDLSFELIRRHPVALNQNLLDNYEQILMLAVITGQKLVQRVPWEIVPFDGGIHCSTLAYIITRKAAEKVLESVKKTPQDAYDFSKEHVSESVVFSQVNTRVLLPPLFTYQTKNDSLIHASHLPMHLASKRRFESWYSRDLETKSEVVACARMSGRSFPRKKT